MFADEDGAERLSGQVRADYWLTAEVPEGAVHYFYWQGQWYGSARSTWRSSSRRSPACWPVLRVSSCRPGRRERKPNHTTKTRYN